MTALAKGLEWPAITAGGLTSLPPLGRTARITVHLLAWPLLVKAGLLAGFALAAAVQHLFAVR